MKKYRILFLLLVSMLLTSLSVIALAQEATPEAAVGDNPTIVSAADGLTLPEGLVSGIVTLTLQNDTEVPFAPIIARLNDGKTMDDFMTAMQQGPAGVLAVVSLFGGAEAEPDSSVDITYDLPAGEYLLLSFGAGPPDIKPFTIAESDADPVEAPEADVTAELTEFAFALPETMDAGPQTWEISNIGKQPHELMIFKVEDDANLEDVTAKFMDAIMAASSQQAGPPQMPYESAFSWSPMSPDTHAWVEVDLEPGTYVVICFIPDLSSQEMVSHFQHGMIKLITVSE